MPTHAPLHLVACMHIQPTAYPPRGWPSWTVRGVLHTVGGRIVDSHHTEQMFCMGVPWELRLAAAGWPARRSIGGPAAGSVSSRPTGAVEAAQPASSVGSSTTVLHEQTAGTGSVGHNAHHTRARYAAGDGDQALARSGIPPGRLGHPRTMPSCGRPSVLCSSPSRSSSACRWRPRSRPPPSRTWSRRRRARTPRGSRA